MIKFPLKDYQAVDRLARQRELRRDEREGESTLGLSEADLRWARLLVDKKEARSDDRPTD